jgi:NAD(P)-dependent dehydrogenase (short-subunit alcohol dehydrogenase family)
MLFTYAISDIFMSQFTDSVAIVTGGGSGIGRTTALAFAERGVNVVIADIDVEGGRETVTQIKETGGEASFVETDVTDPAATEATVETAVAEYGRLDYAFNNAGIGGGETSVAVTDPDDWQEVIDVNLVGVFNSMQPEIKQMQKQESGGAIVNNSSVFGKVGFSESSGYTAAKHGVLGLTKSAALENGETGIRINAVCPGVIETPFLEDTDLMNEPGVRDQLEERHAMNRLGTPEEIAEAVLWLCSDDASFVTGEALSIDGGYLSQ